VPERLRRTIRGLEKLMEPLRYHCDDLEKQVCRQPMDIDLVATMEIVHKNVVRIEQELAFMRERVDMELLLRNDSLADENLPLPGDTPPTEEDVPGDGEFRPGSARRSTPRSFSATGNPFDVPAARDDSETRSDERSSEETLFLKPVKLDKHSIGDKVLQPAEKSGMRRDTPSSPTRGVSLSARRSGDVTTASEDDPTAPVLSNEDTVVLTRDQAANGA
jgi:hypothetical protein